MAKNTNNGRGRFNLRRETLFGVMFWLADCSKCGDTKRHVSKRKAVSRAEQCPREHSTMTNTIELSESGDGTVEVTTELDDKWSKEGPRHLRRERPNGRGYPTHLKVVEMPGDSSSSLCEPYYIIEESYLKPEIVASATTEEEAMEKLVEEARDY